MCVFGGVLCELSAQDPIIDSGELRLSSVPSEMPLCIPPASQISGKKFQGFLWALFITTSTIRCLRYPMSSKMSWMALCGQLNQAQDATV